MDKRVLLVGIVLIIISLFVASEAVQPIFNAMQNTNATSQVISLMPHGASYLHIPLNQSSVLVVAFTAGQNVSFYFMNRSAFTVMLPSITANRSLTMQATGLEGNGIIETMQNYTSGSFPYESTPARPASVYVAPNTTLLGTGDYYAVFYDPSQANTTVLVKYNIVPLSAISPASTNFAVVSILAFIIFLAGAVLTIYGLIRKPKTDQNTVSDAKAASDKAEMQREVDRLYAGVGKHSGRQAEDHRRRANQSTRKEK